MRFPRDPSEVAATAGGMPVGWNDVEDLGTQRTLEVGWRVSQGCCAVTDLFMKRSVTIVLCIYRAEWLERCARKVANEINARQIGFSFSKTPRPES